MKNQDLRAIASVGGRKRRDQGHQRMPSFNLITGAPLGTKSEQEPRPAVGPATGSGEAGAWATVSAAFLLSAVLGPGPVGAHVVQSTSLVDQWHCIPMA